MDDIRFDLIARAFGSDTTRRGIARLAAGGALALIGAGTIAADVGIAAKKGDGARCSDDEDCGKGLFCKRIKKKGKSGKSEKTRNECRYEDGCGIRDDYCDESDDCCDNLKCDRNRNRCVR